MGNHAQKEQSKAQASQRQRQGEIVRAILDQWAEVEVANGEQTPEQGPFLAIDAWAEWTESSRAWQDLRETTSAICIMMLGSRLHRRIGTNPFFAKAGCPAGNVIGPLCAIKDWIPEGPVAAMQRKRTFTSNLGRTAIGQDRTFNLQRLQSL